MLHEHNNVYQNEIYEVICCLCDVNDGHNSVFYALFHSTYKEGKGLMFT